MAKQVEKNADNHRQPNWPLMGYAPGNYIGRCTSCGEQFWGMDKRAYHCLPCAIDLANKRASEVAEALKYERSQNEILRAAIKIVQSDIPHRAALTEGRQDE